MKETNVLAHLSSSVLTASSLRKRKIEPFQFTNANAAMLRQESCLISWSMCSCIPLFRFSISLSLIAVPNTKFSLEKQSKLWVGILQPSLHFLLARVKNWKIGTIPCLSARSLHISSALHCIACRQSNEAEEDCVHDFITPCHAKWRALWEDSQSDSVKLVS